MVKAKSENNTNNSGTMLTAADGTQYFVMGQSVSRYRSILQRTGSR